MVCLLDKIQQGCILSRMGSTFSAREARSITGVSQRCLDYWDELGVVQSTRRRGQEGRRGSARVYEFDDLLQIKIVKQLRATGLSLQKIQKALKTVKRRTGEKRPFVEVLVTDGRRFEWKRADGKVEDLLRSGQLVFAGFAIGAIEADLKTQIVKLEKRSKRKENGAYAS
ncbi:MAG TPA: MerR family transcriptional regulator [Pirellulales bacterium]|nr:MerR family transcriptional regulator [Pirellulales bacterium]